MLYQFLDKNPRPPLDMSEYKAVRQMMVLMDKALKSTLGLAPSGLEELYHDIGMRDGFQSSLKVHKPANGATGPLVVLCFGGGFIGGSNDQLTMQARALVKVFGATVVSMSYRLAPEYKYPYAQHDAWDTMKWIAENATGRILHSDPSKGFIMGGVSAGGALTASLSRIFQEDPIAYPLTGQWLCIPSIMDSNSVPERFKDYYLSSEQLADGPFFSRASREWIQKFAEWDASAPLRYAINSTTPIKEQPPTYVQADVSI